MVGCRMSDPGQAQLDLIRRYARTLREFDADAMRTRRGAIGGPRHSRDHGAARPIRQAAKAMTGRSADAAGRTGPPVLPSS
jgi:hypothetical protein